MASRSRSRSAWPWIIIVVALFAVLAAYALFFSDWFGAAVPGSEVTDLDEGGPSPADARISVSPPADTPSDTDLPSTPTAGSSTNPRIKTKTSPPVDRATDPPAVSPPSDTTRTADTKPKTKVVKPKGTAKTKVDLKPPRKKDKPATTTAEQAAVRGLAMLDAGRLVEARRVLSDLLTRPDPALSSSRAAEVRKRLAEANQKLIFSKGVYPDDPLVEVYKVKDGDYLIRVAPKYKVPYQFIQTVNGIDPKQIRPGQPLKIARGPFHVVIYKSAYRADVYLTDPTTAKPAYIRSFRVGLGEDNSTPPGKWVVRPRSKQDNPQWTSPRPPYASFDRNDPKNPIGEFWIGLQGTDENTTDLTGYGIHGTIEPKSIGKQASMGCVRLLPDDIKLLFHMLVEGDSKVEIRK